MWLSADIELVQCVSVSIVLVLTDFNYDHICAMLGLKPLYIWRQDLVNNFHTPDIIANFARKISVKDVHLIKHILTTYIQIMKILHVQISTK